MSDTTTARDRLLARLGMAVGGYDRDRDEALLDAYRAAEFNDAISRLHALWQLAADSDRGPGINFAIGALMAIRDNPTTHTAAQEG